MGFLSNQFDLFKKKPLIPTAGLKFQYMSFAGPQCIYTVTHHLYFGIHVFKIIGFLQQSES